MQNAESEGSDSVGVSDVILRSQYFGELGDRALCSEQRLMLAVLLDAINVLRSWGPKAGARKRRSFGEASAWVMTSGNPNLFSFDSVCGALNIVPEMLRKRLSGVALAYSGIGSTQPHRLRIHGSNRVRQMTANRVREKCSALSHNRDHRIDSGSESQR